LELRDNVIVISTETKIWHQRQLTIRYIQEGQCHTEPQLASDKKYFPGIFGEPGYAWFPHKERKVVASDPDFRPSTYNTGGMKEHEERIVEYDYRIGIQRCLERTENAKR
jgi:hypothetical protein